MPNVVNVRDQRGNNRHIMFRYFNQIRKIKKDNFGTSSFKQKYGFYPKMFSKRRLKAKTLLLLANHVPKNGMKNIIKTYIMPQLFK